MLGRSSVPFEALLLCFLLDFFLSGMLPKLWRNNLDDAHLGSVEFSQISPQNLSTNLQHKTFQQPKQGPNDLIQQGFE